MGSHTKFYKEMYKQQLAWRRGAGGSLQAGNLGGKCYDHLFPDKYTEENLWPELRLDGQFPLLPYLEQQMIQPHHGMGNLLSSWTLCANLYFPFGRTCEGRSLLAGFMRTHVAPGVATLSSVELEWEHPTLPAFRPPILLGEKDGSRGAMQTSPDVAFQGTTEEGKSFLILTEVKFTEPCFYPCSAFKSGRATLTPDQKACRTSPVGPDPEGLCGLHHPLNRRYWNHLKGIFVPSTALRCCPASTDGYQLFRQQALAEGLAHGHAYDLVVSAVAYHEGNDSLIHCLAPTGIPDFRTDWAPLFRGQARFATFSHQQWVSYVRSQNAPMPWCQEWLGYVAKRYGL